MKLIVELSENDYKALKEDGVQNHLALADTIIACSVPYEERPQGEKNCFGCQGNKDFGCEDCLNKPKNDLISREALKEDFKERNIWNPEIISAIDNAPTVDVISNEEGYEMYGKGYLQGYERGKSERHRGEWIEYKEDNEIRYYCSNCMVTKGQAVNNFCACCGADMRNKNKFQDLVVFDDQPKKQLEDPDCHNEL